MTFQVISLSVGKTKNYNEAVSIAPLKEILKSTSILSVLDEAKDAAYKIPAVVNL
jgi:hypothetical protein